MDQKRLEILQNELETVTKILDHQFIERDIALILQDVDYVNEIHNEINAYIKRKDAIKQLITSEEEKLNGLDFTEFEATIFIHPHVWGNDGH